MRSSRALAVGAALTLGGCANAEGKKAPPPPASPAAAPAPRVVTDVTDKDYAAPALPKGRVTLLDVRGKKHPVDVEVAATNPTRTRGLMWRTSLDDGKGMLFIFSDEQMLSFWMRNTLISLDMLFIDKDLNVAGIVENASPQTLDSRGVGKNALFVLEVPGGYCKRMGIAAGSKVTLEGVGSIVVER